MHEPSYHVYTLEEKRELAAIIRAANEKLGVDYNAPYVTPQENRALMEAEGLRPEDNVFQRELLRMRYGGEPDEK